MDVLGHEDVGGQAEVLLFAGLFEDLLDGVFCFFCVKEGLALVTTEGDEVELVGLLEAFQARWHGGASSLHPTLRKGAKDGAPGRSLGESSRVPEGQQVMKWSWLVCWKRFRPVGMVVRTVYIPPFAKARRMGHPGDRSETLTESQKDS